MPRPLSAARLVAIMEEDVRLGADIARLTQLRADGRQLVVADLQTRKGGPSVSALGKLIELGQQYRRRPSTAAAKERLADRPELLARVIVEQVDGKELAQLLKDHLLEEADLDFIAPTAPHGGPYPTFKTAPRGRAPSPV